MFGSTQREGERGRGVPSGHSSEERTWQRAAENVAGEDLTDGGREGRRHSPSRRREEQKERRDRGGERGRQGLQGRAILALHPPLLHPTTPLSSVVAVDGLLQAQAVQWRPIKAGSACTRVDIGKEFVSATENLRSWQNKIMEQLVSKKNYEQLNKH